ncbi:MAG: hypothetical protein KatS3mg031_1080 [Chitinophagales bacterium]|nr:MAG: hypothetical protein KatS3mg031_1080 [Chitinophagales bacterium]
MFSRCYATISDLILDLTGVDVPLPVFSYGFFVALGFLAAAYILSLELRRKEKQGLLKPYKKTVIIGNPASPAEIGLNALLGFLLGFKLIYVALNYTEFAVNPQRVLLSAQGSWAGGVVGAFLLGYLKFYEKNKNKLPQPKKETVEVYPHETVGDLTIVAAVSGIVGAKLFYLFESPGNLSDFLADPLGSFFGGLTVYGGLILGTICVSYYAWKRGMNPVHIADGAAPGLFLAYSFGRMGCQVAGDGDWGIVNTLSKPHWLGWLPDRLWSFTYPHNIINEGVRIPGCAEAHCYVLPHGVFPTPIYESTITLILFFLLWAVRKRITTPGLMISCYFILAGLERFFIEKIRVNTPLNFFGMEMTQAEFISILYIMAGGAGIIYFIRRAKRQSSLTTGNP